MRTIHGVALAAALLAVTCAGTAQETPIPFARIQRNAESFTRPAFSSNERNTGEHNSGLSSANESGVSTSLSTSTAPSSAAGIVQALTRTHKRSLGKKYFLLNTLHLGMAVADLAVTQHCIAEHRCREGNPMMPPSLAGRVSVDMALVGFAYFASARLKRHDARSWWLIPVTGIVAHGAGVATGLAHH